MRHLASPRLLLAPLLLACLGAVRAQEPAPAAPALEVRRDVVYGDGGGQPLKLDLAIPAAPAPRPLVLLIHGGGWVGGARTSLEGAMRYHAGRGYLAATISYRFAQQATWPAQLEDCKCAVRWFRAHAGELGLDPARIAAVGFSAGAHLAALLGTAGGAKELEGQGGWAEQESRVQAVVSVFGPSDLTRFPPAAEGPPKMAHDLIGRLLGGAPESRVEAARQASPVTWVSAQSAPFLLVHGDRDRLVPLEQSQLLAAALQTAGVEARLRVVEGAGHGQEVVAGDDVRGEIDEFLDRHLRPAR